MGGVAIGRRGGPGVYPGLLASVSPRNKIAESQENRKGLEY